MRKKLLFLLPLLLMPLTACDMSGLTNKDSEPTNDSEPAIGERLDIDKKETINKLKTYGQTIGFEFTADVKSSDEEGTDESTIHVGMKDNVIWVTDEDGEIDGIELIENAIATFTSNDGETFVVSELGPEAFDGKTPEEYFEVYLEGMTSWLYMAEKYEAMGLTKVKDTLLAGRNGSEYSFALAYAGTSVTYKAIIDNDLDITLYLFAEVIDEEGNKDTVEFEIKTFLSGDQVKKPNYRKSN